MKQLKNKTEKKYWLVAAVTLATLGAGTMTAQADSTTTTDTTQAAATGDSSNQVTIGQSATDASTTDTVAGTANTGDATNPLDKNDHSGAASEEDVQEKTASADDEQAAVVAPAATEPTAQENEDSTSGDDSSAGKPNVTDDASPVTAQTESESESGVADMTPTPVAKKQAAVAGTINQQTSGDELAPTYTDSGVFNWAVNDADATATLTGANQALSGTISIPPTYTTAGKTYQVTTIGEAAFAQGTGWVNDLTGVIFNQGLTTISQSAFAYVSSLNTLDFTNATDLTTIGNLAFVATGVSQLILPDSVTTIGDSAFTYAPLTQVVLPANLTKIGTTAFAAGSGNTALTVDFSKVTQLTDIADHAFESSHLVDLVLPASVQRIGLNAFANNHELTTVTFAPNSQLITIADNAFIYDGQLTAISFPDSLRTIGQNAFLSATNLQSVTFGAGLQAIGSQAFTYDSQLSQADFSHATALQTIGDRAFEYANLQGSLTLPPALTDVGNEAFAGNQLTQVTLNAQLRHIGQSAFSYNRLARALTIPAGVISVGSQAFFGNELTAVTIEGTPTLGQDALSYNRITQLSGPGALSLALNQNAIRFTDSNHLNLTQLFTLKSGDQTEQNLQITDMTSDSGTVSLLTDTNAQRFIVSAGTRQFAFNWSLTSATGQVYSGRYTVVLDDPDIEVMPTTIFTGTTWNPSDNFISAQTPEGVQLTLDQLTVTGTVDTQVAGDYQVTYSYGAESVTTTVTVKKRLATVILQGSQTMTYTGKAATVTAQNYTVNLPDGSRYQLQAGDLDYVETTDVTGQPVTVTLSAAGLQHLNALSQAAMYEWQIGGSEATYLITPATIQVTVQDATKAAGQADPDFTAIVTGKPVDGNELAYQIKRVEGETEGSYKLTVDPSSMTNPNYTVLVTDGTLTITATLQSLTGQDYTMYVGDPTPGSQAFQATATDVNGLDSHVTVDLTQATLDQAGNYSVVLTSDDGQKRTVTLIVKANLAGITGHDVTIYTGEAIPTVTTVGATATDRDGDNQEVTGDFSGVNNQVAGSYEVYLKSATGLTKVITVTVLQNLAAITGQGTSMYVGDELPSLADLQASATDKTGQHQDVTADFSQVNSQTPGDYEVRLTSADGQLTTTVQVTVLANQASLKGEDYLMYTGEPLPTLGDLQASATDKAGNEQAVMGDFSQVNPDEPGTYNVVLTSADGRLTKTVQVHILQNLTGIVGNDQTIYVGDELPTLAQLQASATDKTGAALTVTGDFTQVQSQMAGRYPVVLTASDGQTRTVWVTVLASQATLTGGDYTMTLGDPTPSAPDFQATATDKTGNPLSVQVDLSAVDLTQPGTYQVGLTTVDGQRLTVTLTILASTPGNPDGGHEGTPGTGTPTPGTGEPDGQPEQPGISTPDTETPVTTPQQPTQPDHVNQDTGGSNDQIKHPTTVPGEKTPTIKTPQVNGQSATVKLSHQANHDRAQTQVTKKTSDLRTGKVSAANTTEQLPQTNEQVTNGWATLGLFLGSLGLSSHWFRKRRD